MLEGALYKRRDFLGKEEGARLSISPLPFTPPFPLSCFPRLSLSQPAPPPPPPRPHIMNPEHQNMSRSHPNRTYYFRKAEDLEALVEACSKKLGVNPVSNKALHIRASGERGSRAGVCSEDLAHMLMFAVEIGVKPLLKRGSRLLHIFTLEPYHDAGI
jgi:hypothetical protein